MGKKKVSQRGSNKLPTKIEIQRGITVVELTRRGRQFFDSFGREYQTVQRSDGSVAYYLKKAIGVTSKILEGTCNKNSKHKYHTDTMPRSKKCSCGGTYSFIDLRVAEVDQVGTSNQKGTTTPKKRKGRK